MVKAAYHMKHRMASYTMYNLTKLTKRKFLSENTKILSCKTLYNTENTSQLIQEYVVLCYAKVIKFVMLNAYISNMFNVAFK